MVRAVRWKFCTKSTKTERASQRKNFTLRDAAVTERTQEKYYIGMRQLLPLLKTLTNGHELDEAITDWIEQCWKEGETLGLINDALCGLHHFAPWTKKQIPQSWKLFAVWRKLEGPSRAPPITANIVYCLANYALEHCDIIFAGMLLIGFFGLFADRRTAKCPSL